MLRCLIVDDSPGSWKLPAASWRRQGIAVVGCGIQQRRGATARGGASARTSPWSTSTSAGRAASTLPGGFTARPARPVSGDPDLDPREQDYAELIAASPAVGFLAKTAISASAIQELLDSTRRRSCGDSVSGPQGT